MPDDSRKGQGKPQHPPPRPQSNNPPSGALKALSTGPRSPISRENAVPPAVRTEPVSGARVPIVPPPRTQSSASNPRAPITGRMLAMKLGAVETKEQAERQILSSEFAGDDVTQFDGLIDGNTHGRSAVERDDDESTQASQDFDGLTPAPGLTSRDTLKAVVAPMQSREGRRSAQVYRKLLDQFAVGANPRYDPDAPDKPRAHIFVWDVTRAMNCEIPHFLGGREMSLGLMVEWLRHEAPMRGWRRATESVALMAANQGCPVVVVPKELRIKLMAMARPGAADPEGNPLVSAAAVGRGNGLTVKDALGVFAVEYFVHP